MAHLYLVRHAESELNLRQDDVWGRSNYANLTERGVRQAQAFGKWMKSYGLRPDVVYTSPAVRTIDTMRHSLEAAEYDHDTYIVDYRIQELSQGIKEGAPRDETYTDEVLAQIREQQLDFKFEGGDSISDVARKMESSVADIAERHAGQNVFMYTHGFAIRSLYGAIENLSHREIVRKLETPNVSLTKLFVTPKSRHTIYFCRRVIDEDSV